MKFVFCFVFFHRVVWLTTLKRRPHLCRECRTSCLMRQTACLIWALVGWNYNTKYSTLKKLKKLWKKSCIFFCFVFFPEYQVRSVASHVRPDRQSECFSFFLPIKHFPRKCNKCNSRHSTFVQRHLPEEDREAGQGHPDGSHPRGAGRHRRGAAIHNQCRALWWGHNRVSNLDV